MLNPTAIIMFVLSAIQVLLGAASVYSLINQAIMIAIPLMFSVYIVAFIKFYYGRKDKNANKSC